MRNLERLIVYPIICALLITTGMLWQQQRDLKRALIEQANVTHQMLQKRAQVAVSEKKKEKTEEQGGKALDEILAPFYNGVSEVGKLLDRLPELSPLSH